jgi:hypothetical protein
VWLATANAPLESRFNRATLIVAPRRSHCELTRSIVGIDPSLRVHNARFRATRRVLQNYSHVSGLRIAFRAGNRHNVVQRPV